MSAEIIQFVPAPNPNRPTLIEDEEIKAAEFLDRAPALAYPVADTSPSEYSAPDAGDCA